ELNALVMDFALPAALFLGTASTSRTLLLAQWPILLVLIASMLVIYSMCYWMQSRVFGLESSEASVQALNISLPNFAAAGLPLLTAVFGARGTIYVALSIATGSIFMSPLTLAVLEANKRRAGSRKNAGALLEAAGRSLSKPIVLAPLS